MRVKPITWQEVFNIHVRLHRGEYCSEVEIWQREADMLNKRFDVGNEARRVARNKAEKPPSTRKIGDKRNKSPKHKKPLQEE